MDKNLHYQLKKWVEEASSMISFTGAGISTESNIPDYRSQGGLWDQYTPVTYQEFLESKDKREEYWERKLYFMEAVRQAKPNSGHAALTKLFEKNLCDGIITQNIDGYQQLAGFPSKHLIELHGTNQEIICLDCDQTEPWGNIHQQLKDGQREFLCKKCDGLMKPNTISFGQSLRTEDLIKARQWAENSDLFLAIGSTLVVEPAASLPVIAKQHGAKLVIITISETPLDQIADLKINHSIGETLSQLV